MGIKDWVIPRDDYLFDLLDRQAAKVVEASHLLVEMVEDFTDLRNKCHKMAQLEHDGDLIAHDIHQYLNTTFITPLEPEEISALASSLDDILDFIESSTQMMCSYGIREADGPMREFAKLIRLCATETEQAIRGIRKLKDPVAVQQRCIEINRLENLADDVLSHAIRDLFQSGDAITIIKLKDIYENLEGATDRSEDVANIIGDIVIRHT